MCAPSFFGAVYFHHVQSAGGHGNSGVEDPFDFGSMDSEESNVNLRPALGYLPARCDSL